ncbi:acetyltransferase [Vibrio breoganii]|uniref:NeuD/PglB/VioB family sugar acetyltransferase n=1 Tax=Vibrio breoganii TaxID=553239 RepID=UPI000C860BA3|nr:NeuD/PglB/VioB family sugar acetyltransferase [Vibrio breoganii]PMJ45892.1 acetyltransferase [Vibrio breoganii]PMK63330.1 acetyltransferase [Vibrio breoganii]PML39000.1 acetyltransferase [Vibrio breoganii]PMO26323.1 acetyltransferase [Vibrio breoganii]PMO30927.1 acetyltransferase [Vibrio breoganii]
MSKKVIGIYGASGFGREVMPLVAAQFSSTSELVFIDDGDLNTELNGYAILSYQEFLGCSNEKSAIVAIADSSVREKLTNKLQFDGVNILSIEATNVVNMDHNDIGEGSVLCPFVTITSNTEIGKGFHANIYSYVAHDCVIGDYVTFAPRVMCNGNVHIENHAYIGTGAIIKQGTPSNPIVIGEGAVVGMGSVVTKSVKPGDVVFGVPAKSIKRG